MSQQTSAGILALRQNRLALFTSGLEDSLLLKRLSLWDLEGTQLTSIVYTHAFILSSPLAMSAKMRCKIRILWQLWAESSPRPAFRPFNFKKNPPARKKKYGKAERGEGGAPSPRGAGRIVRVTTDSERTKESQATTRSARAHQPAVVLKWVRADS